MLKIIHEGSSSAGVISELRSFLHRVEAAGRYVRVSVTPSQRTAIVLPTRYIAGIEEEAQPYLHYRQPHDGTSHLLQSDWVFLENTEKEAGVWLCKRDACEVAVVDLAEADLPEGGIWVRRDRILALNAAIHVKLHFPSCDIYHLSGPGQVLVQSYGTAMHLAPGEVTYITPEHFCWAGVDMQLSVIGDDDNRFCYSPVPENLWLKCVGPGVLWL